MCSRFVIASAVLALVLLAAAPALAVTFSQSGDVVQITTTNDVTSWRFDVYHTNTTETPIPTTKKYGDWVVPAGQTAFSLVLPPDYRRYRFDVVSVMPTGSASIYTLPMSGQKWQENAVGYHNLVQYRGGVAVGNWSWGHKPTVIAGDVLQYHYDYQMGVAVVVPTSGTVTALPSVTRLYDEDEPHIWSAGEVSGAFTIAGAGSARLDDSGSGTFDNPSWVGYHTTEPTPTIEVTVTIEPTGSIGPTGSVETSVTLSGDDAERLELIAAGVALLVLLSALLVGYRLSRGN